MKTKALQVLSLTVIAAVWYQWASPSFARSLAQSADKPSGVQHSLGLAEYGVSPLNLQVHWPYRGHGDVAALTDTGSFTGAIITKDIEFAWFTSRHGKFFGLDFLPTGINRQGQVVGTADIALGSQSEYGRACLWENGHERRLSTPRTWGSFASAINDSGEVAGDLLPLSGKPRAVVWLTSRRHDLGVLPGYSESKAEAINDHHQVLVIMTRTERCGKQRIDRSVPYLWQARTWTKISSLATETAANAGMMPTGDDSPCYFLNNRGDVLEWWIHLSPMSPKGALLGTVGLLWQQGHVTRLSGFADLKGLNDKDEILGDLHDPSVPFGKRPALWQNGKFHDLSSLLPPHAPVRLDSAGAMNNLGQVIANGTYDGKNCLLLLTPSAPVTPV